jgi:hypothetical protein
MFISLLTTKPPQQVLISSLGVKRKTQITLKGKGSARVSQTNL